MIETVKVVTIVGAGPQFIKASAVSRAVAEYNSRSPEAVLVGADGEKIAAAVSQAGSAGRAEWKSFCGDGRAAERICEIISGGQTEMPHEGKR